MGDEFGWQRPSPPPFSEAPNWSAPALPPVGAAAPAGTAAPTPPPNGRSRWSRRRTVSTAVIAAAAGALAFAGVSVASAQSSGTTPPSTAAPSTPSTTTPQKPPGPRGFRGGLGPFVGGLGAGGAIHGEYVRPNGSGYQTVDVQVGTVQKVSQTSIEVKSADNFDKTYSVTTNTVVNAGRDGIGTVKAGDKVSVSAVVNGTTPEARSVMDSTSLGSIRQHWSPQPPPSTGSPSTGSPSTSTP